MNLRISTRRLSSHTLFCALLGIATLAPVAMGCGKGYIVNTSVPDTGENRKVIGFCETYRTSVEARDITKLLAMTHPSYFEDGGNADPKDDIDYRGFEAFMRDLFSKTSTVRYEIRYRKVSFLEPNRVLVDYTYSASFKIPTQTEDEWHRKVDDNRLELMREGDTFKIVSGM